MGPEQPKPSNDLPIKTVNDTVIGDARAIPVSGADSGDIGPSIGASAERRQEHDKVSPPPLSFVGPSRSKQS